MLVVTLGRVESKGGKRVCGENRYKILGVMGRRNECNGERKVCTEKLITEWGENMGI